MPKDLTDVSQWEVVEVPVGTDPATASSVETPFQLLTDRTKYLRDLLAELQIRNWEQVNASGPGPMAGGTIMESGCYDPVGDRHFVHVNQGGIAQQADSQGGYTWQGSASSTPAGFTLTREVAVDHIGTKGQVCAGGGDQVGYEVGWGGAGWQAWAVAGAPSLSWRRIYHDWAAATGGSGSGLWVIADSNGLLYQSPGPATPLAPVTVDPAFAGGTPWVKHTHHPAGFLHSADPGNPYWCGINPVQSSRSADGLTWNAAAAHGLSGTPLDLDYSALGERWIAPLAAAGCPIGMSGDNGENWSEFAVVGSSLTPTNARIACDMRGNWVLLIDDGANWELYVSSDNGDSWTRVYLPDPANISPAQTALWYGDQRFVIWTGVSPNWEAYTTLRGGE